MYPRGTFSLSYVSVLFPLLPFNSSIIYHFLSFPIPLFLLTYLYSSFTSSFLPSIPLPTSREYFFSSYLLFSLPQVFSSFSFSFFFFSRSFFSLSLSFSLPRSLSLSRSLSRSFSLSHNTTMILIVYGFHGVILAPLLAFSFSPISHYLTCQF